MTILTVPKQVTRGEELIIIPRREYEKLLSRPKIKKIDPDLEAALEDVRAGRLYGPFKTVEEFKKAISRR